METSNMNSRPSTPEIVCLQCGDVGFSNAFVYCVKCLKFVVHRYCLKIRPKSFNEYVRWFCDDCEAEQNQHLLKKSSLCKTRDHSNPDHILGYSVSETKKNDIVLLMVDEPVQSYDARSKISLVECSKSDSYPDPVGPGGMNNVLVGISAATERKRCKQTSSQFNKVEKIKDTMIFNELSAHTSVRDSAKEKRSASAASVMKKDHYTLDSNSSGRPFKECTNIGFSERAKLASDSNAFKDTKTAFIMRKDHHTLGNNSSGRPYKECTNVGFSGRANLASDSTAKDGKAASILRNDQHTLGNNSSGRPYKECTNIGFSGHAKLASDSTEKDGKAASIMRKDRYTLGNNSSCRPNKECTNIGFSGRAKLTSDSTAKDRKAASIMRKDGHTLGNNSSGRPYEECTNIGFNERAKLASDSTSSKDGKAASIMRKDQYTFDNNSSSRPFKECTNIGFSERAKLASDSTAKDRKAKSIMRKDQHTLGNNSFGRPYEECTNIGFNERAKLASDSTSSKDGKAASIMRKDQYTFGNNSSCRPFKECTNIGFSERSKLASDSTASKDVKAASIMRKDQYTLGNNSFCRPYKECTNFGFSERAELASDSTASEGVKENKTFLKRDHDRFYQQHNGSDPETSAALPPLSSCSGSVGSSKKMKPDTPSAANLKYQKHKTFFAQHLKKHKGVILGTQCSGITTDRRGIDLIRESEVSKEGNSASKHASYSCEGLSKDSTISPIAVPNIPAEPIMDPIWRGSFNIWNKEDDLLEEVMAHLSILACQKVFEEASQFTHMIHLEMLSISHVWPKSFENSEPSADNIAIYFFPSERSERVYDDLVNELVEDELALKAFVLNAELLVFPSTKLPLPYWRFQGKYYLWGVFVEKESSASSGPESRYNPVMHKDRVDNNGSCATGKNVRRESPLSPLSNCSSYGSRCC